MIYYLEIIHPGVLPSQNNCYPATSLRKIENRSAPNDLPSDALAYRFFDSPEGGIFSPSNHSPFTVLVEEWSVFCGCTIGTLDFSVRRRCSRHSSSRSQPRSIPYFEQWGFLLPAIRFLYNSQALVEDLNKLGQIKTTFPYIRADFPAEACARKRVSYNGHYFSFPN